MLRSFGRAAEITVPLERAAAMAMFTPEGERCWAGEHGWDPQYPDPTRTAGVGAVFVTAHGGVETTWVIVDHSAERMRYVRVTPGGLAGTVEVAVRHSTAEATTVRVTYDLTALQEESVSRLQAFAAGYDAEIASWGDAIRHALAANHGRE
jgi:hypothetical protein